MDQTYIHLTIAHLPIFGSILGAFVLVQGLWTKSNPTKIAAYTLFIISSIGAGIAYTTGEAAEEIVENIQGIAENRIEQHEEFALIALVGAIILGAASLLGVFLSLKKSSLSRTIAFVILFISLISFGLVARTGYLGGQIRHTEVNSSPTTHEQDGEQDTSSHHQEDHDEESPPVLLNNGKKWAANAETTEGIKKMNAFVNQFSANPKLEDYHSLKVKLETEFDMIIQKCTMTGEAHNQLHNYLLPMKEVFENLNSQDIEVCVHALNKIKQHINEYENYFL